MYRTTNIGLAAWLLFCGLEPEWLEPDPATKNLVLFFLPSAELSREVHRFRFGDGLEETVIRNYNAIVTRLTNKRPVVAGAGHE
jgi:hypothetical protein